MLAKQYSHRLPADYDIDIIRRRAAARGKLWNDTPGLAFKAFVLQEKGRYGANGNLYASVYLWHDVNATIDFLSGSRFRHVIDSFGRPQVELWLPLDARSANECDSQRQANWLYREILPIADDTDLDALRVAEVQRNQALLQHPGAVALVSAINPANWQLVRLHLSSIPPDGAQAGDVYEVLYLARPELSTLAEMPLALAIGV
jgi:hypothetical protein